MTVRVAAAAFLFVTGFAASSLAAGPPSDLLHHVYQDFLRNNCWPEPFLGPDRQAARAPFGQMVHNGWQRQNLLHGHYFDQATGRLNEAGRLKVQWVLTEAPPHHRSIYVQRGATLQATAERVASVQAFADQVAAAAASPQSPVVAIADFAPVAWPATQIDAITRGFEQNAPPPRLPGSMTSQGQK